MLSISPQKIPVKKNRVIAFFVHYLLMLLLLPYLFVTSFRKNGSITPGNIRKLLIIRMDGLGDIVMSTSVFKAIREIFPDSHITLLTTNWSRPLVEVMPTFDKIIYFDAPWVVEGKNLELSPLLNVIGKLRGEKFDMAVDLRGDFRNIILMRLCKIKYRIGYDISGCHFLLTNVVPRSRSCHAVEMGQSLICYLNSSMEKKYDLSLWLEQTDKDFATEFFRQNQLDYQTDGPVVVMHPGCRWLGRRWTLEGYAEIADRLISEYKATVIFTGSPDDIGLTDDIVSSMAYKPIIATGRTSIRQFVALVERSDLFIGVDSGPMHMATAVGTKVIALFGAARPEAVGPYGDGHVVITKQDNFPCSPCAQTVCKKLNNCMQAIGVEDVWQAVETVIKSLEKQTASNYENTSD